MQCNPLEKKQQGGGVLRQGQLQAARVPGFWPCGCHCEGSG